MAELEYLLSPHSSHVWTLLESSELAGANRRQARECLQGSVNAPYNLERIPGGIWEFSAVPVGLFSCSASKDLKPQFKQRTSNDEQRVNLSLAGEGTH